MDDYNTPEIKSISTKILDVKSQYFASEFYNRLINDVINFEKNLNQDEEVGARLVSFNQTITIHIDNLGYCNPSLIYFYGRDNNDRDVQLIQHISQINILLTKVPRTNPNSERIGFKIQQKQNG